MIVQVHQVITPDRMEVTTVGGPGPEMGPNWQTPRLGPTWFPTRPGVHEYVLCLSYNECDSAKVDGITPYAGRDKVEIRQLRPGHVAIRIGDCEVWIDCSTGLEAEVQAEEGNAYRC